MGTADAARQPCRSRVHPDRAGSTASPKRRDRPAASFSVARDHQVRLHLVSAVNHVVNRPRAPGLWESFINHKGVSKGSFPIF